MTYYQKPKRQFEKSGLVIPDQSYHVYLENVTNTDNEDIRTMVDKGRYFTIFAPRQSGKTTFFYDFCRSIEDDTLYIPILLSFQTCQQLSGEKFYKKINKDFQRQLLKRLSIIGCKDYKAVKQCMETSTISDHISFYDFFEKLNDIIIQKKIVIFIDEFDGIPLSELSNFLMTLRDLYQNYKGKQAKALYSIGLVGIRNIAKLVVGGVSPFNIADQVYLPSFSLQNVHDLYTQYTQETNQSFTEQAINEIYNQTNGQPWLVNRLGTILTVNIKPETTDEITLEDVNTAINLMIKENNSHFENLYEKIVLYRKTFQTILNDEIVFNPDDQAQSWLRQYGLIKEIDNKVVIANHIYKKRFAILLSSNNLINDRQPKKIFICYSREDQKWLTMLLTHLKILAYEDIECWYDEKIQTGETWEPEIANAIETSHLAICLISTQFLASDYIRTREVPALLNKYKQGMRLFPLLIEHCAWKRINWLKDLQIHPKNGQPLDQLTINEQKKLLIQMVDEIGNVLETDFTDV
ncbi:ATPase AAA [Candidatus Magnetomorum sp. HK-1]|nr:ATPase AAA [Candidatus Magnetomorum sp. HK-1]